VYFSSGRRLVALFLVGISVLTSLPLPVSHVQGSTTPYPVLRAGDYWNFQYSTGETSHETISNSTCDGTPCLADAEVSVPWSDTVWRNADWSYTKENYTDSTGIYLDTYSPTVRPYDWPLAVGKQWTLDITVSEITKNSTGTYTSSYRDVRTRTVVSETSITVPAGTFNTFQVDEYKDGNPHTRRWLSYDVGDSVRWEYYRQGQIVQSSVLTSYSLSSPTTNGPSGPSGSNGSTNKTPFLPTIFSAYLIAVIGAGIAVALVVTLLAIRHERRRGAVVYPQTRPPTI